MLAFDDIGGIEFCVLSSMRIRFHSGRCQTKHRGVEHAQKSPCWYSLPQGVSNFEHCDAVNKPHETKLHLVVVF